ncbi:MAG: hypothetical protein ACMVO3_00085 [Thalassobaculum sp.]
MPPRLTDGSLDDIELFVVLQDPDRSYGPGRRPARRRESVVTDVCDDVSRYEGLLSKTWANAPGS